MSETIGSKQLTVPFSYLDRVAQLIYGDIARGESGIFAWFPAGGKSTILTKILSDNALKRKYLGRYYRYHKIFYIDATANPEATTYPFLQYLARVISGDNLSSPQKEEVLSLVHNRLSPLLRSLSHDHELTLVIDRLETYSEDEIKKILRTFEYLLTLNRRRIHFQFHGRNHNLWPTILYSQGTTSLAQNVHFVPLPTPQEAQDSINSFLVAKNILGVSPKTKAAILATCGTNPPLIRIALRMLEKGETSLTPQKLLFSPEIVEKVKVAWRELSTGERQAIKAAVTEGRLTTSSARQLLDIGALKKRGNQFETNGEIFAYLVRHLENLSQEILLSDQSIDEIQQLSPAEKRLLKLLLGKKQKICTRDEIAETLWGSLALQKFSNWAIDQTVARLRDKLTALGYSENRIVTVRGHGYKLIPA